MTGDGRIIEVQGTAEKTPFSQDEFLALMALAQQGRRQAGGPAEDGGGMCADRAPGDRAQRTTPKSAAQLVIATHNPGKWPRCANCCRRTASTRNQRANSVWRAGGNRRHFRRERQHQGAGGCDGGSAGLRRQFRSCRRCAGRRARIYSARWAGPAKDFDAAMRRIERLLRERGATAPEKRRRISSRRCAWPGPTATSRNSRPRRRHARLAAARRAGFGYDPMFLPDGMTAPSAK